MAGDCADAEREAMVERFEREVREEREEQVAREDYS